MTDDDKAMYRSAVVTGNLDEFAILYKDAARYRWLRERLMAADFDWQDSGECALVFAWPKDCAVSGNCDATIDGAMLVTANV